MTVVKFNKIDETSLHIECDDHGVYAELSEYFTFMVDGYKFMPSYRNKMWDGKIRIFNSRTRVLPYGLLQDALQFLSKSGYDVILDKSICDYIIPDSDDLKKIANDRDIRFKQKSIHPHHYQLDAYCQAIQEKRSLIISPTGSGKSLIIYLIARWFLENYDHKILIVVPTTSLTEQMSKDFAEYSSHDTSFAADENIHVIYSGKEKNNIKSRVVITTWQSAIRCDSNWFLQYGMVIGDEAHLFKAKSLNDIMSKLKNAQFRIGTTGTLDGSLTNEKVLIGNFGPVHRVITTKELIENDTLAQLKIKCIVLNYADEVKKLISKVDYKTEIDAIISHDARNQFIKKLALDQKGNTLVLFNLVHKHGKPLYEIIRSAARPDRKIFYVSGQVEAAERETIRELTENEKDAVIVASSATFSTGINIKNLHTIIFAAPTKSQIRVLQSIGRGLRKSDDGRNTTVYDISDNFSWKKTKNYTLKHAVDRIKIYAREGFDYKIYEVPFE